MKEIPLRFDPSFVTPFFQEIGGQFKPKHALQPSHLSGSTFSAGLGLILALLNKAQGLWAMMTDGPSFASSSLMALLVAF
jgi:hypothetical protein